jgi:two-component system, OmpR family, KDP operon response regulator KdpE
VTRAMHRVLVVEDDPAIRKIVSMLFETNGFRVVTADTCDLGVRQAQTYRPDVCIVDLGLPDKDGINFIRKVRDWSPVAILVLTARVAELQRLSAFEAGADDYIIKPFSSPELLARVRAIMRRMARSDQPGAVLRLGDALIDFGKRVTRGPHNVEVHLTPLEHRILECLARHADSVVTHTQVMKEVWGPHQIDIRALRVYVASLRRKLEFDPARPKYIVTEPGVGYRLVTDSEVEAARPDARNRLEKSL